MLSIYSTFQMSPVGINTASAMYGIHSAEPETATVLEIGCGEGFDLISRAVAYPRSTCIGIDIDSENILKGQCRITSLGINNAFLYCLGIEELLSAELSKFNYIIIHEVFSLLDDNARAQLLIFCEQHLTSDGILAVKWNTLPGTQITDSLRGVIALHCQNVESLEEKIASAKAMLAYMDVAHTNGLLKEKITEALGLSDAELAIRYIYNKNDARYLTDFNFEIESLNLKYVGDMVPQYEMAKHYGENISLVHTIATQSAGRVVAQQYLDFAVNRHHRFSLLVSSSNSTDITDFCESTISHLLKDMHWAANYHRKNEEPIFYNPKGEVLSIDDTLLCRIFDVIGSCWPLSVSTTQLIQNTLLLDEQDQVDGHSESVLKQLFDLYVRNISGLYISRSSSPYNNSDNGKLKLIYELSDGAWESCNEIKLCNLWGENVALTEYEFKFIASGAEIKNKDDYFIAMKIVRKGLLTGSNFAWLRLYKQCFALQDIDVSTRRIDNLTLFAGNKKYGGFYNGQISKKQFSKNNEDKVDQRTLTKSKSLFISGRYEESFIMINDMLKQQPDNVVLISTVANFHFLENNYDESLKYVLQGLSLNPHYDELYWNFARVLVKKSAFYYSSKCAYHYLRKYPRKSDAWTLLTNINRELQHSVKHEYCARKAVEADKNNPDNLSTLGNLLSERGLMSEARVFLEKAVQLTESNIYSFDTYSNYLFSILHDEKYTHEDAFNEHQKYGNKVSQWAKNQSFKRIKKYENKNHTRLRIGFVSGDLYNHPVSKFILPVLKSINMEKFDLVAYNVSLITDNYTRTYKTLFTDFYNVQKLSYVELANKISNDSIDILIDLSGHTGHNRLPTFGLKPAPIQMSWIGYPGTTGVKEIDYYIVSSPLGADQKFGNHFIEKIACCPSVKNFEHPEYPAINPLPALENGYITFASFNRPQKLTPAVLDCWAKILTKLPESKILLASMTDQNMIDHFIHELEKRGVEKQQIIPRLKLSLYHYFNMHNEVDVLLDTFPYTGGTTVCFAHGMGVPTITYKGSQMASQQGAMIMDYLGLNEFIAENQDDYVNKALELNEKYEYLNTIRLTMRDRVKRIEDRVDNPAYYFEKLLEAAWLQYENGKEPEPIIISE